MKFAVYNDADELICIVASEAMAVEIANALTARWYVEDGCCYVESVKEDVR